VQIPPRDQAPGQEDRARGAASRRAAAQHRRARRRGVLLLAAAVVLVGAATASALLILREPGDGTAGGSASAAVGDASPSASPASASPPPSPSPSPSPSTAGPPAWSGPSSAKLRLDLAHTVTGNISPKSVVSTQTGYVFAQNMMYTHTVTVYDAETYKLVKTISDSVDLAAYGHEGEATVQGAPVEAAVAADYESIYVSQYSMYGPGYAHQGDDDLGPGSGVDRSFVYRIGLDDLSIDEVIKVGSVPKYLAATPDGKYVLVSNWVSWDLSVIDVARGRQVKLIDLGPFPRGIAVDSRSRYAYIAVMGSGNIARLRLADFHLDWITGVGSGPRHLCISPDDRWLYVTLNAEGTVGKIDLRTRRLVKKVYSGVLTRSMTIAPDGDSLYVVNYESSSVSKIRAADMKVLQQVATGWHPIGITYDAPTKAVWVACYGGSIMVFRDV